MYVDRNHQAAMPLRAAAALLLLFLIPAVALAQATSTTAVVLQLPSSARALALGDAYAAAREDEAVLFYNPGNLATVRGVAASLSVQEYLASSKLFAVTLAVPVGPGSMGLGLQVLDYGTSEQVIGDPSMGDPGTGSGATLSAGDYVLSLGYGVRMGDFRAGLTAKYVAQLLGFESGGAAAADFGVALDLWRGASVGAALQNVGGNISLAGSSGELPRVWRVGVSTPPLVLNPVRITGYADLSERRGSDARPSGGVELGWTTAAGLHVLGRVGMTSPPDRSVLSPLAFGGGFRLQHLSLDYAYQSLEAFGATHRFGLRWWR
jgi:hypothetical protein